MEHLLYEEKSPGPVRYQETSTQGFLYLPYIVVAASGCQPRSSFRELPLTLSRWLGWGSPRFPATSRHVTPIWPIPVFCSPGHGDWSRRGHLTQFRPMKDVCWNPLLRRGSAGALEPPRAGNSQRTALLKSQ